MIYSSTNITDTYDFLVQITYTCSTCSTKPHTRLSHINIQALNTILIRNKHNMKYYIDYHSYGNMWTNAYGAHNWLPKNEVQLVCRNLTTLF